MNKKEKARNKAIRDIIDLSIFTKQYRFFCGLSAMRDIWFGTSPVFPLVFFFFLFKFISNILSFLLSFEYSCCSRYIFVP